MVCGATDVVAFSDDSFVMRYCTSLASTVCCECGPILEVYVVSLDVVLFIVLDVYSLDADVRALA